MFTILDLQSMLFASLLLCLARADVFLVGSKQDLLKRDSIVQGWALVEDQCPPGTGGCGARSCCPFGSYCDTSDTQYSNLCCPTREGCGYNVTRGDNRCALDSWVLFTTNKEPICCLPGEIGTNAAANENYGHCMASGLSVPSASMATLIGSTGATAPATLPTGYTMTDATSSATVARSSNTATTAGTSSQATTTTAGATGIVGITPVQPLAILFGGVVVLAINFFNYF